MTDNYCLGGKQYGKLAMESKKQKYGNGVVVAVITPLKKNGNIDQGGLQTIISHSIPAGWLT